MRNKLALALASALLAIGGAFWLLERGRGASPETALPDASDATAAPAALTSAALELSPAERESLAVPAPPEAPAETAAENVIPPPVVDTVGPRDSWPAEYAGKPLDVLVADEKRLREEHNVELDAEIERRFANGEVETYRQGEQPHEITYGRYVGRGDETHIRVVNIDPRVEPQWFAKEWKATWLFEEIRKRQKPAR